MAGLCWCIRHRTLRSLCLPPHAAIGRAQSRVGLQKEWEECVSSFKSCTNSYNHSFQGPWKSQWQPEWGRCRAPVITEATEATCPVQRAGRWHFWSGTAGEQSLQQPPVYGVRLGHRQLPSGHWRWARQPGSLPQLIWWLPASVALPKGWKKRFFLFSLIFPDKHRVDLSQLCHWMINFKKKKVI